MLLYINPNTNHNQILTLTVKKQNFDLFLNHIK